MSDVLVREVIQDSGSNYVIQKDAQYLNTDVNSENEKEWMSLDDTLSVCCNIIQQIIKITERFKYKKSNSPFDSYDFFSAISLYDYFGRIVNYMKIDKNILMLSMMNLDKFLELNQEFILSKYNCHKLIFLSVMETNKYYDDDYLTNQVYSKIGGIDVDELLKLEIEYLTRINWKMTIDEKRFYNYSQKLESIIMENNTESNFMFGREREKINN